MAQDDWDEPSTLYTKADAVAELVERESAVGKTDVCGLNSGSVGRVWQIDTAFAISVKSIGFL